MSAYEAGNHHGSDAPQSDLNHNDAPQHLDYPPEEASTDGQTLHTSSPPQQDAFVDENATSRSLTSSIQHAPAPPLTRNTAPPGHFDMLPPPNSTHASWQALHDYAQTHASEHGYALSINTTAKNRSRIKLACVCYGQPKNTHKLTPETRVRKNRVSYKTGCKMWIEGKRTEHDLWTLKVGEPKHNHAGRASEGWAVQRKRTWGVVGGRVGVGGVTAKEELAKTGVSDGKHVGEDAQEDGKEELESPPKTDHSLERGGVVWTVVEQEMLPKGEPTQGRDRGVGRTVEVLQARLPGIQIFKRDVYNIRAQIKRTRKAAGQQVGAAVHDNHDDAEAGGEGDSGTGDASEDLCTKAASDQSRDKRRQSEPTATNTSTVLHIDPALTAEAHIPLRPVPAHIQTEAFELEQTRKENAELRRLLVERTKEVEEKTIEIASLRSQIDYMMLSA